MDPQNEKSPLPNVSPAPNLDPSTRATTSGVSRGQRGTATKSGSRSTIHGFRGGRSSGGRALVSASVLLVPFHIRHLPPPRYVSRALAVEQASLEEKNRFLSAGGKRHEAAASFNPAHTGISPIVCGGYATLRAWAPRLSWGKRAFFIYRYLETRRDC